MLNKTPLFHPSLGLRVFLFLSLFLSFSLSQREKLLSSLSCPGLQDPRERAPCAYVKQCKPRVKGFIGFLHKPRNISLFLSLFYFLIIDSRPPGSSPLKDLNKWRPEQGPGTRGRFGRSDLLRWVSTKTWDKRLESPITFLLYFITY